MKKLFLPVFRSLLGLDILPHARECGAILVVGGAPWSSAQMGVESDEPAAAINIEEYTCRYYLPINSKLPDNFGLPRARAFADDYSRDITMSGELVGQPQFSVATACEIANDQDLMGSGNGDVFCDEFTDTQRRGDWRKGAYQLSADPGVTVV